MRENPDAPYYMHTCLVGLDLNSSLYDQRKLQVHQQGTEIPKRAPACPIGAAHLPFKITQKGVCVMTLIGNQHTVVEATAPAAGQIPGITTVTTRPRRSAPMSTPPASARR